MRAPIGLRIRNLRNVKGLSQAGLARDIGISPSYLNLIESNRRDVGGAILHKIADVLNVQLPELTGDSEQRLISELHEAFSDPILEPMALGLEDAHTLVARMPELARAFHQIYRAYLDARASAFAYSNRLRSDPLFAKLLHQMLTQITAVRSASEILQDVPDIDAKNRADFYGTIHAEARELSVAARSLISQFEHESAQLKSMTPSREVDDLLIEQNNYFPQLEDAAAQLRKNLSSSRHLETRHLVGALEEDFALNVSYEGQPNADAEITPRDNGFDETSQTIWFRSGVPIATQRFQLARHLARRVFGDVLTNLVNDPRLTSAQARNLALGALSSYLAGALLFPYSSFRQDAINAQYDLDFLSQRYSASFEQVAHRLVTLRAPDEDTIPFGFIRSDPAGFLSKQFPLPGLLMPNAGHACPLWAVFNAFRAPNAITRQAVRFADGSRYLFIAKASAKRVSAFAQPQQFSAVMVACDLIHADKTVYGSGLNLESDQFDVPVGPTCRLCVRSNCAHRQENVAQNLAAQS